jgi:hypothetical protein
MVPLSNTVNNSYELNASLHQSIICLKNVHYSGINSCTEFLKLDLGINEWYVRTVYGLLNSCTTCIPNTRPLFIITQHHI